MSYTIRAARYANHDETVIEAVTDEAGPILIAREWPQLWPLAEAWIAAGNVVEAFVPSADRSGRDVVTELDALKLLLVQKNIASAVDISAAIDAARTAVAAREG